MPTLDELKQYLRIDGSEDDMSLALFLEAAREYLFNAGVPERVSSLYKLAVMRYVAIEFENRGVDMKEDRSLNSMIWQLKSYAPVV
ncbi:hypothetical protein J31TS4_19240 [Paenibacillus sp. J31TS4]|uniref:head-tail connector protein n=1 Tax=Paenibacillus sp. J31TS4 TaxID=2807195 RepID=UPI001B28A94D|nr:head-tail connector protein [Paenibacillus sp. J31TS4]GIP38644.1 hypothetical protein J31TS4_19240 [Paenibacillus sp. J31TS4]